MPATCTVRTPQMLPLCALKLAAFNTQSNDVLILLACERKRYLRHAFLPARRCPTLHFSHLLNPLLPKGFLKMGATKYKGNSSSI